MTRWPETVKLLLVLAWLSSWERARAADDPLAAKTMTVFVTNSTDSVAVKDHYIQARYTNPSSAPVCGITLPNPSAATLNETDYVNSVKMPVRACLSGKNILYIVLAYVRPFGLDLPRGIGYYAMDSYLADIWDEYSTQEFNPVPTAVHRYYADAQNLGNVYLPFVSLEAYRAQPRSLRIYSVWRLDGATPAIANGLVDKAIANMNILSGAACIDRNRGDISLSPDSGYLAGDWDLRQAAAFLSSAGMPVTEDANLEEFGTSPAPAKCPANGDPVAFYAGWYSLNNYNGASVFQWAPGAIGFHLDSNSLVDPRAGANWSANAIAHGITVTSGSIYEPYLEGLPRPAGVYRNLLEGANVGDAFLRNTRWVKWMIVNIGDPLYRPFPASGIAPFNPPEPVNSLAIAARALVGGGATTGTVRLATAPPPAGLSVALSSSPGATVPPSVNVAGNGTSATFPITTSSATEATSVIVSANIGSAILRNSLTTYPLLSGVGLSQSRVSAGQTVSGTVILNASAPAGGITVSLLSTDTSVATVPASVFVPAGLGRVSFAITTFVVTANKVTQIRATHNGTLVSADLTAVPALSGVVFTPETTTQGGFVLFEVYLNVDAPAGGITVNLTNSNPSAAPLPASITVPAGTHYGNAGFAAGPGPATATVQASYGGDTKSAILTIN